MIQPTKTQWAEKPRYRHLDLWAICGHIPEFLSENDPRPAKEQFTEHYGFAGGWQPFEGHEKDEKHWLKYPGDPGLPPLAQMKLREELILIYEGAWVVIVQLDGSWECARMD